MSTTREYNNASVSLYNEYGTQDKYNTLFASKLPETVPSMHFPTLLDQHTFKPYGYDALTHDGDGTGYYTVGTGYSKDCDPKYNTVKCPQNRILRPFLPDSKQYVGPSACPVRNEPVSEGYEPDLIALVRHLKMSVFVDLKNCPHSYKLYNDMISAIGLENVKKYVQIKDISIKSNEQQLTNLGGYAVPFTFSHTTNNSVTGYFPLMTLLKDLSVHKKSPAPHSIKDKIIDLKIKLYVLKNCIFCQKMKELLKEYLDYITIADATDPAVKDEVKQFPGFPVAVSQKTKKMKIGLPKSIDELIIALH